MIISFPNYAGDHEGLQDLQLTGRDIELITQQCRNQDATTPEEVARFTAAYIAAKDFAFNTKRPITLSVLQSWAYTIDSRNSRFRSVPVIINYVQHDYHHITRETANLVEAIQSARVSPVEAYEEFEEIHPYVDGNGRTGHLLWAVMTYRSEGTWPEVLPPDLWANP